MNDLIKKAFNIMFSGENQIQLSDKGKEELERCWEGSSSEKWEIHAVWIDYKLTICSENHSIFDNAPLDWFILT